MRLSRRHQYISLRLFCVVTLREQHELLKPSLAHSIWVPSALNYFTANSLWQKEVSAAATKKTKTTSYPDSL